MRIERYLVSSLFLLGTIAVSSANYIDNGKSITVKVSNPLQNGAKLLRMEVITGSIIRVRATNEEAFPDKRESLMIVLQKQKATYKVIQKGNLVTVSAKDVKATVDVTTGHVAFYDSKGHILLNGSNNGITFKHFAVPENEIGNGTITETQRNGWSWNATFESSADEAFYGLGQHQADEYNYKGKNEELFQYNTKISVPFVISNKNWLYVVSCG